MLVKPILLCYLVDSDLSSVERYMPFEYKLVLCQATW